jgi:DNA (cytosine-5)-methyltransferase 1
VNVSTYYAYYNEHDAYAAQWLRNLIKAGHITDGEVDERSIEDVAPDDVKGFRRAHWFAGIGVWDYALNRAGWPDDRQVWTGSCPCQPFSVAGKGDGFDDERHLWPAFHWLIEQRRPLVVFGEQVASKDGYSWLDLVQNDLEGTGYTVGAVVAPAAGFGAPHQRHRMYWVADASDFGQHGRGSSEAGNGGTPRVELERFRDVSGFWSAADWIYCRDEKYRPVEPGTFPLAHGATARVGRLRAYGNAICAIQAEEFIKAYLGTRP